MTLMLRPADAGDATHIANIYLFAREDALPDLPLPFSDREVRAWVQDDMLKTEDVWVASEAGVLKGFIAVKKREVTQLWVSPPFQRKGVGKTLLTKMQLVHGKSLDITVYKLSPSAGDFLVKEGFKRVGPRPPAFDGADRELYRWRRK